VLVILKTPIKLVIKSLSLKLQPRVTKVFAIERIRLIDSLVQADVQSKARPKTQAKTASKVKAAVIGAGPAGLMAALQLAQQGIEVHVYDAMPSVGRKFLLAGLGGLNLTHNEASEQFNQRFGAANSVLRPYLLNFGAAQVRDWCHALGVETFVGSSQRVFPKEMKAAPLLRRWLTQLRGLGVQFHARHRWLGWTEDDVLQFHCTTARLDSESTVNANDDPGSDKQAESMVHVTADVTVLALGGASWQRLGSDGAWVPWLTKAGVPVAPLKPSNSGFDVAGGWSQLLIEQHAGAPLKSVTLRFNGDANTSFERRGECVVTKTGIEGSLVYAASAAIRDTIEITGTATICLDFFPDWSGEQIAHKLNVARASNSLSNHLRHRLGLDGVKRALLYEMVSKQAIAKGQLSNAEQLAFILKNIPLTLERARPIDEAISTAGGVCFDGLDEHLMLQDKPGVFCAGEMLDWEAPTGGYLLTACLSTGRAAGIGAVEYLNNNF
jgi:uncharacterized flavoprotein (TIGR03862 family)